MSIVAWFVGGDSGRELGVIKGCQWACVRCVEES